MRLARHPAPCARLVRAFCAARTRGNCAADVAPDVHFATDGESVLSPAPSLPTAAAAALTGKPAGGGGRGKAKACKLPAVTTKAMAMATANQQLIVLGPSDAGAPPLICVLCTQPICFYSSSLRCGICVVRPQLVALLRQQLIVHIGCVSCQLLIVLIDCVSCRLL